MAVMLPWTNSRANSVLWGDFSVKSNLESAKEFSRYLHMPAKSCCWLCCCAFRIKSSQVKVIHFQWSAWIPAINSPQGFLDLERNPENMRFTRHMKQKMHFGEKEGGIHSAADYWFSESKVFQQFPPKLLLFVISKVLYPKTAPISQQVLHSNRISSALNGAIKSSNQKGFSQRQVKSRLFGMNYYFDDSEHSKWRCDGVSCLSYRVLD